jgi:hypothetical protein
MTAAMASGDLRRIADTGVPLLLAAQLAALTRALEEETTS